MMTGRGYSPLPRPTAWRLYGGLIVLGSLALLAFGLAAWMILLRPQAEPFVAAVVPWIFRRSRRPYAPEDYAGYVALLVGMGTLFLLVGIWTLRAIPASERRLDARLSSQLEAEASRHTRARD